MSAGEKVAPGAVMAGRYQPAVGNGGSVSHRPHSTSSTPRGPGETAPAHAQWSSFRIRKERWRKDLIISFTPEGEREFRKYFADLHFLRGRFFSVVLFLLVLLGAIFATFGIPHQIASRYAVRDAGQAPEPSYRTGRRTPNPQEFAWIAVWTSCISVFVFSFHLLVYFTDYFRAWWQVMEVICFLVFEGWCYAFFTHVFVLPATYVLLYSFTGSLSNSWFRLRWEQSAFVHGLGLIILPIGLSWSEELRNHGEWGIALVVAAMNYVLMVGMAWDFERNARLEFRRMQRMEADTRAFLAANEELTDQLRSKFSSQMDMSSPLDNALKSLNGLLERALADRRVDDATDLATALRHLMSTANLNAPTQLAEQGDDEEGSTTGPNNQYIPSETVAFLKVMTMDPLRRRDARGTDAAADAPPRSDRELGEHKPSQSSVRATAAVGPPAPSREVGGGETAELAELWAASDGWMEFNIFRLDELTHGRPLAALGHALFRKHGLVEAFNIRPAALANFLEMAEAGYVETPYHCRVHAADVLQGVNYLLTGGGLGVLMRPLDVFAALVAAIVHDLEHPGRNNAFEIATSSERALLYNDRSVLENYSASRTFALLREEELDVLAGLSRAQRAEFRKSVISMLLATDLAAHFDTLGTFKSKLVAYMAAAAAAGAAAGSQTHGSSPSTSQKLVHIGSGGSSANERGGASGGGGAAARTDPTPLARTAAEAAEKLGPGAERPGLTGPVPARRASLAPADAGSAHQSVRRLSSHGGSSSVSAVVGAALPAHTAETADTLSPEDRQLFLNMAIKVADIANAARPPRLHAIWVDRVMAEFFEQGDEEKRLGLPLSPYCDRDTTVVSKCQAGFIDFLAAPLFTAWGQRFPRCQLLVQLTDANRKHWLAVAESTPTPAPPPAPGAGVSLKLPPSPKSGGPAPPASNGGLPNGSGSGTSGGASKSVRMGPSRDRPLVALPGAQTVMRRASSSGVVSRARGSLASVGSNNSGGEGTSARAARGGFASEEEGGEGEAGAPQASIPSGSLLPGIPGRKGTSASVSSTGSDPRPPGAIDSPRRGKRGQSTSPGGHATAEAAAGPADAPSGQHSVRGPSAAASRPPVSLSASDFSATGSLRNGHALAATASGEGGNSGRAAGVAAAGMAGGRMGPSPRAPTSLVVIDPQNFEVDPHKLVMRPAPTRPPSGPDPPPEDAIDGEPGGAAVV